MTRLLLVLWAEPPQRVAGFIHDLAREVAQKFHLPMLLQLWVKIGGQKMTYSRFRTTYFVAIVCPPMACRGPTTIDHHRGLRIARNFVVLHSSAFSATSALDVSGDVQVGWGEPAMWGRPSPWLGPDPQPPSSISTAFYQLATFIAGDKNRAHPAFSANWRNSPTRFHLEPFFALSTHKTLPIFRCGFKVRHSRRFKRWSTLNQLPVAAVGVGRARFPRPFNALEL